DEVAEVRDVRRRPGASGRGRGVRRLGRSPDADGTVRPVAEVGEGVGDEAGRCPEDVGQPAGCLDDPRQLLEGAGRLLVGRDPNVLHGVLLLAARGACPAGSATTYERPGTVRNDPPGEIHLAFR